jgi:hypothetical protein
MSPGKAIMMFGGRTWSLKGKSHRWFRMEISARNGSVVQYVYLRRIDGVWRRAIRVTRQLQGEESDTEMKKMIEKEYPRDQQDDPEWVKG